MDNNTSYSLKGGISGHDINESIYATRAMERGEIDGVRRLANQVKKGYVSFDSYVNHVEEGYKYLDKKFLSVRKSFLICEALFAATLLALVIVIVCL